MGRKNQARYTLRDTVALVDVSKIETKLVTKEGSEIVIVSNNYSVFFETLLKSMYLRENPLIKVLYNKKTIWIKDVNDLSSIEHLLEKKVVYFRPNDHFFAIKVED